MKPFRIQKGAVGVMDPVGRDHFDCGVKDIEVDASKRLHSLSQARDQSARPNERFLWIEAHVDRRGLSPSDPRCRTDHEVTVIERND